MVSTSYLMLTQSQVSYNHFIIVSDSDFTTWLALVKPFQAAGAELIDVILPSHKFHNVYGLARSSYTSFHKVQITEDNRYKLACLLSTISKHNLSTTLLLLEVSLPALDLLLQVLPSNNYACVCVVVSGRHRLCSLKRFTTLHWT